MKYTQSATAAHVCRCISVSVGDKFRRFLKYSVFVNDSLSLSYLSAASRVVTARALGLSDLSSWVGKPGVRLSVITGRVVAVAGCYATFSITSLKCLAVT